MLCRLSQASTEQLSDVFSRRLKTESNGDAVTSDGDLFLNTSCSDSEGTVTDGDTTRWWNVQLERRSGTKSPSRVARELRRVTDVKEWWSHPYLASNGRQAQRA